MKRIIYSIAVLLAAVSCIQDLDQAPRTKSDASQVYSTTEGYKAVLAKLYASFVIAGQEQGGSDADLDSNEGHDFLRGYINLQEAPTDEMAPTWLSGDDMTDLAYMTWDANDPWVTDTYYRLYYTISLCNEFISHAASSNDADVALYCKEARFLRALAYWYVLDLFGQGPFVDETMGVGAYTPECYDGKQLFSFVEGELKDIELEPKGSTEYGRAPRAAVWALLSRLYLNAEVYGAGDHYSDCIEYCKKVIADGYTLEGTYTKLFNASNNKRTNEIIFPFVVDGTNTVSWGATTYLVCGELGNDNTQDGALFGVDSKWGMFRARGEFTALFDSPDGRALFWTADSSQYLDKAIDDQSNGWFVEKWSNLTDDGEAASSVATSGASIDFPVFRLAEIYLTAAEAVLRGGLGLSVEDVLGYVNKLRFRAYGDSSGKIAEDALTLDFILDERARELYWECSRRTDLVRYGRFSGGDYIWQWKGGVKDGTATDSRFDVYPIPDLECSANPNITNKNY